MRLAERNALVTGANGGIGSAIAMGLAKEGANVALHVRKAESGEELRDSIRREGCMAEIVVGDVAVAGGAQSIVDQSIATLGSVDILVNNAGIMSTTAFLELSEEEWRRIIDVNLTGYFLVGQAAARHMVASTGGQLLTSHRPDRSNRGPAASPMLLPKAG